MFLYSFYFSRCHESDLCGFFLEKFLELLIKKHLNIFDNIILLFFFSFKEQGQTHVDCSDLKN